MQVAAGLVGNGVHLYRAGVWKPRTRPGSFEGNGVQALAWLQEMTDAYQLPYTVEVAEPYHIDEALKHGAAALWIGARTTVNPFHVQKLADALAGVQVPVLVKNPVNPDTDLWLGAIERFERAGVAEVAAIHRGFSGQYVTGGYRNQPLWPIPIELKRRRPELFMICDPSHITGARDRVAEVAQRAMDLGFGGLMIETHPDPEHALTDAAQQVTPTALLQLLSELIVRQENTIDLLSSAQLESLRRSMDSIDAEIVDLIARRMELSARVGEIKKVANITAYQPTRWREIVEATTHRAALNGLPGDFILGLYERIHEESIRTQLRILTGQQKEINK